MIEERVAVIGAGNLLQSDEGVGVHVIEALEREYTPSYVHLIDAGTALADVLAGLDDCRRVFVIDAVKGGSSPGTVYRLALKDLRERAEKGQVSMSLHQMGLLDAVDMARLGGSLAESITVIGVEPENLEPGIELSETLVRKLPDVCHLIQEEVRSVLAS
jgi:hydrogenase maturation protease